MSLALKLLPQYVFPEDDVVSLLDDRGRCADKGAITDEGHV